MSRYLINYTLAGIISRRELRTKESKKRGRKIEEEEETEEKEGPTRRELRDK